MSVRGVPAQDRLENQDPAVLFTVDEVTKVVTPIECCPATAEVVEEPKPAKRRGRKAVEEETSAPAEDQGE